MKTKLFLLGAALMLSVASCSEDNTDRSDWIDFGEGVPVIEKVVNPMAENAEITSIEIGNPIKVIGQNLYSVDKATVNGVDATNYISHVRDVMYIVVPNKVPETPTGKLTIENKWGKAEVNFTTIYAPSEGEQQD